MKTIARAVAWQTWLLRHAISGDGLTRHDAERAFATLDQLARLLSCDPGSVPPSVAVRKSYLAVCAEISLRLDAALRSGDLFLDSYQRIRVVGPNISAGIWHDLNDAVLHFCPQVILRQMVECEWQFKCAGGEPLLRRALILYREMSNEEQKKLQDFFQLMRGNELESLQQERKHKLSHEEITILMIKKARDALNQIAADVVRAMLCDDALSARFLGGSGPFSGWCNWPTEEWRRHSIAIVLADTDAPTFEVVSDDGSVRIQSDQFQLGSLATDASAAPAVSLATTQSKPRTKAASSGHRKQDEPIISEMHKVITRGEATSPWKAAQMFLDQVPGASDTAKLKRLSSLYKQCHPDSGHSAPNCSVPTRTDKT